MEQKHYKNMQHNVKHIINNQLNFTCEHAKTLYKDSLK